MIKEAKQFILSSFHRLGYILFQKKAFETKVKQTETPEIKQAWLDGVKLVSDRISVLRLLPKSARVAELGVGYGDFSKVLIKELQAQEFVAIDTFDGSPRDKWGEPLKVHQMTHHQYYLYNVALSQSACEIKTIEDWSWEGISKFDDAYFDFIYIDADHSYAAVKKDIEASAPKVKVGGYIQCNDFTHFDTDNYVHYGVPRAVFELLETGTFTWCYLCLATSGFYDVVLKRIR
jgi:hypothetical protein